MAHHVHPGALCWSLSRRVGRPHQFTVRETLPSTTLVESAADVPSTFFAVQEQFDALFLSTIRRRIAALSVALRAERAKAFVQLGELSAARGALEGVQGTLAVARVTNPERRPLITRQEVSREVADTRPTVSFTFDQDLFLISLRRARRGGN